MQFHGDSDYILFTEKILKTVESLIYFCQEKRDKRIIILEVFLICYKYDTTN